MRAGCSAQSWSASGGRASEGVTCERLPLSGVGGAEPAQTASSAVGAMADEINVSSKQTAATVAKWRRKPGQLIMVGAAWARARMCAHRVHTGLVRGCTGRCRGALPAGGRARTALRWCKCVLQAMRRPCVAERGANLAFLASYSPEKMHQRER